MTDHIDHAAKARKRIQWINEWQEREGDTPETHLADALVAQAESTLALVRQQQIANLIALAALAGREDVHEELAEAAYRALGHLVTYELTGPDDEVLILHPDIAAALGIGAANHE